MTLENAALTFSRRHFIASASAFALAPAALHAADSGIVHAYAGTYTTAPDGHGEGIYIFDMDTRTGELTKQRLAAQTPNPSWICIHPSKKYLYAINEMTGADGARASVTAFSIEAGNGNLTQINSVSSEGAGPAHLSLDAQGKFAFVANYAGGSIAVLPIKPDGSLDVAVYTHRDTDNVGSKHATNAPRGSFTVSGHERPHAHMILPDPSGKFVLATDLGQDRLYVYAFDSTTGKLTPAATPYVSLPSGDGPRHFAFHPNGRWLYLLEEESSTIVHFHYDSATGGLALQQTISELPPEFAGSNTTSEIVISSDGRFVYTANRLHDTITICSIGSDGRLTRIGEASTMGDYPRHFCIDPSGKFAYSCDQRSDSIATYTVNRQTGMLTFTGKYTGIGSPAILTFLV